MPQAELLAPRLDGPAFGRLEPGDPDALRAHADIEGFEFRGADVAGLDLVGIEVRECSILDLRAHDADLRGARFADCLLERLDAPVLRASRSTLRDVAILGSRIGSAELYESEWRGVRIADSKLGFVNLRGSKLHDILFENCTIDELDLGGARAERIAFVGCSANRVELPGAQLKHADLRGLDFRAISGFDGLRGATISTAQVLDLAPLFATDFGILID